MDARIISMLKFFTANLFQVWIILGTPLMWMIWSVLESKACSESHDNSWLYIYTL